MQKINVNADLGEMAGQDEEIMPYLSSCNIATGGHVGDEQSMQKTIELAREYKVKIGAHPSYPDRKDFGRIRPEISDGSLIDSLKEQLELFLEITDRNNVEMHHIKPHGTLYHDVVNDQEKAELFLAVLADLGLKTDIYTLKNGFLHQLGLKNHKIHFEAFIDRRYNLDLNLVARNHKKALIMEPEKVWQQLYEIAFLNKVTVLSGTTLALSADTYCIHGDHPKAALILNYIQTQLKRLNS